MRQVIFIIIALVTLMGAFADSQYSYSAALVGPGSDTTSYTILPNTSMVTNTSFYLRTSHASTTANSVVTFYYNDSTTAQVNSSTSSLSNILFVVSNPYRGKLVDKIYWSTFRSGTTNGEAYMTLIDFWTAIPTASFSLTVNNSVNGSAISGFCALFSQGTSLTCTIGNGTPILSTATRGWNTENRSINYARLLNAQEASGNVTRSASIGGVSCAVPPWYTQSNYCTSAYFNTGCGIAGPSSDYYCLVTDELSQRCLSVSMSDNSSKETEAIECYNTLVRLNSSTYGTLTTWTSIYDNRTGTPSIAKTYTVDNAGDADARNIISLFNTYNNPSFTNTSAKALARTRAQQLCLDFVRYNFVQTNKISRSNSSRNMTWFPAGGGDVKATGISGGSFMFSGYYGDYALALLACGVDTGNSTYYSVAQDTVENLLAASNWTTSSGFKVPPGRAFNWTTGSTPTAKCNVICNPDYIDDPDGKRLAKICGAERLYRDAGRVLHPNIAQYCSEWYALNTPSTYAKEWFTNGTRKSDLVDDYDANALGTYLDMSQNSSNIGVRMNLTGNKFSTTTATFDSAACQGLYNPSFPMEVQGYVTSAASLITFGAAGASSCSAGTANSITYTQNGITLVLNSPVNLTNTTSTSVTLNVTIYNTNSSGTITPGTLPQTLYNTNFSSDPSVDGWTLNSWSYSAGVALLNNSASSSGSLYTKNFSLSQYTNGHTQAINMSAGNTTNMKWYFGTTSNSANTGDRILLERNGAGGSSINVKHDGGNYSSITIAAYAYVPVFVTVNQTLGTISVSNGTASWTEGIVNGHTYGDYSSFEPGQSMELGGWNISNYNLTNIGTAYNTSSGANESMNVTFYGNAGTKLFQVNTTANASTITYSWTVLSGTNNWWVNVWSNQSNRNFGNFTFTIYNTTTNATYCTSGTTITHNTTGVYNITIFNITNGAAAPTYFNITYANYDFNTSDRNYEKNLTISTYQSLISLQAYRLFIGNSIAAFNATLQYIFNTTSANTILLRANNGTNTILVDVAGNYSMNVSCTATAPLTTSYCNATGVYDDRVTVGANYDSSGIRNFTLNVTNSTLGGLLYSINTNNGSIILPLLQGYMYKYDLYNASPYSNTNSTQNASNSSNNYNFSVYITNVFDLTFKNESTNAKITNQTVYVQILSEARNENYTTTNGTLFVDFLVPGNYTIRYYVTENVPRDYFVTFTGQSYNNITLYVVDESISQFYMPKVYNQNGYACSQNTVSLLRYFILGNNSGEYKVVEMAKTDSTGQAVLRVVPNIINYKFGFSGTCGNFVSAPQKITASTNSFTVTNQITALTSIAGMPGVSRALTFNNATNTFVCTWTDTTNLVTSGTMKIAKQQRSRVNTTYFLETTETPIGSISHTVTDTNETVYTATCTLHTNTKYSSYPDTLVHSFLQGFRNFGMIGVFLTLIVFLVISFMGGGRVEFIFAGAIASLFIMGLFGFMFYTWTAAVGLLIIAVIVAYKSRT